MHFITTSFKCFFKTNSSVYFTYVSIALLDNAHVLLLML